MTREGGADKREKPEKAPLFPHIPLFPQGQAWR